MILRPPWLVAIAAVACGEMLLSCALIAQAWARVLVRSVAGAQAWVRLLLVNSALVAAR